MDRRASGHVDRPVNSLAEFTFEDQTIDSVLALVGRLAVESMDGWDAAASSLVAGDAVATYGATDERMNPVDQAQYDGKTGPCVDALRKGEIEYFNGTNVEPRWREFAETAADCGVYSVLSFPLRLGDEVVGALNLYSSERDAIRPGHREEGSVLAAQAAVAVANIQTYLAKDAEVRQLEEGLKTRTLIGQATGLLMAQEGLTSQEAFQRLVYVSQTSNIKLRDIAQRYVDSWEKRGVNG